MSWQLDLIHFNLLNLKTNEMFKPSFPDMCCYCMQPASRSVPIIIENSVAFEIPYCEKHGRATVKCQKTSEVSFKDLIPSCVIGGVIGIAISLGLFALGAAWWSFLFLIGMPLMGYIFGKMKIIDDRVKKRALELGITSDDIGRCTKSSFGDIQATVGIHAYLDADEKKKIFKIAFANQEYAELFKAANAIAE